MIIGYLRKHIRVALTRIQARLRGTGDVSPTQRRMSAALVSMHELSRAVYLMHARDELSLSDIACRLDLAAQRVEQHLVDALVHLDDQIGAIAVSDAVAQRSQRD